MDIPRAAAGALNDARTDALGEHAPRAERVVQEALLQVRRRRQAGQDDQPARVVGKVDAVVAVGKQDARRARRPRSRKVALGVAGTNRGTSPATQVARTGPARAATARGRAPSPRARLRPRRRRRRRRHPGRGGEEEEASPRAVLVPAGWNRQAIDLVTPNERSSSPPAPSVADMSMRWLGVGERRVLARRRDQRPDQDRNHRDVDQAMPIRRRSSAPVRCCGPRVLVDRVAQDVGALEGGQRRHELDLAAPTRVEGVVAQTLDERPRQTRRRRRREARRRAGPALGRHRPEVGDCALAGVRVVEDERLRLDCRVELKTLW